MDAHVGITSNFSFLAQGLLRPSMYVKRLKLPPTQLFEEHVDGSYPSGLSLSPSFHHCCSIAFFLLVETNLTLGNADAETTPRPDFRCIHHRSATSSQNAGRLGDTLAGKGLMSGTRASGENNNRQAAGIIVPCNSG